MAVIGFCKRGAWGLLYGCIEAYEGIFFAYYSGWFFGIYERGLLSAVYMGLVRLATVEAEGILD